MSLLSMQLRTASFRGVRFAVAEADHNAGRRVAVHEYPLRDVPYAEDMGRATRSYSLTAYIVGTDYIARTKRLIEAMEKPGPGKLIHPWLGELDVVGVETAQVKFDQRLGLATVGLAFVEAGALENPAAATNWITRLRDQVDAAVSMAEEAFDKAVEVVGQTDSVIADAAQTFGRVQALFSANAFLQSTGIADAVALIDIGGQSSAAAFAVNFARAMDCSALAGSPFDWKSGAGSLAKVARSSELAPKDTDGMIVGSADELAVINDNAIKALSRHLAVIQAAGCASLVEGESYDSLIECRDAVCESLDAEVLACEDDELAQQLDGLRSAVHAALTDKARDSARLIDVEFPAGAPLVVAAYRQYQDADRADEIAQINAVRNIGFSPASGIKVLSE